MKNLIYLLTMLFNAFGFIFSVSLLFYINTNNLLFLPIVGIGCLTFSISFVLTLMDYLYRKKIIMFKKYSSQSTNNNKVVINYQDYFISHKSDFIIG